MLLLSCKNFIISHEFVTLTMLLSKWAENE